MLANLDNEVVFKKAFTDKTVFTCFVKDILDIDFKVNKIETEKKFSPKEGGIDIVYDIFAESADHRVIIEIQRIDYDYGFDRFMRYHMMAIAQLQKNSKDYQICKDVYTIVVFSKKYKTLNRLNLPIEDEVLFVPFDAVNLFGKRANIFAHKIIFLNPNYYNENIPTKYRDWLDLIYESIHNPDDYELNTDNLGVKTAIDLIEFEFFTDLERSNMKKGESRKKVLNYIEKEGIEKGFKKGEKVGVEKGKVEGKIEGKIEGKLEIARNLLDVLDVEIISKKTGLSIEQIETLK